jgi:hypothetical protein
MLDSVGTLVTTYLLIPTAIVLVALALARASGIWVRYPSTVSRRAVWAASAAFALVTLVVYSATDPVMNYELRYATALYPLAVIALAAWADRALKALGQAEPRRRALAAVTLAALVPLHALSMWIAYGRADEFCDIYRETIEQQGRAAGTFIRDHTEPGDWIAVVIDAGIIPYTADRPTLDLGGLADREIARAGADAARVGDNVYAQDPAAIVITSIEWKFMQYGRPEEARAVVDRPEWARYHLAARFRTIPKRGVGWTYYYFVYMRDGLPGASDVENARRDGAAPGTLERVSHGPSKPARVRT